MRQFCTFQLLGPVRRFQLHLAQLFNYLATPVFTGLPSVHNGSIFLELVLKHCLTSELWAFESSSRFC